MISNKDKLLFLLVKLKGDVLILKMDEICTWFINSLLKCFDPKTYYLDEYKLEQLVKSHGEIKRSRSIIC